MKCKNAIKAMFFAVVVFVMSVSLTACGLFPIGGNTQQNQNKPTAVTVTISDASAEIEVGESIELAAVASDGSTIEWLSDDDEIAVVDEDGVVTGVSAGDVRIIANCGKAMAFCDIIVSEKVQTEKPDPENPDPEKPDPPAVKPTIGISESEITLEVGDKHTLTATVSDGSQVVWHVGDPSIISVANGEVTALAEGKTQVIAASGSVWARCNVTVNAKPPVLDPTPGDMTVPTGYTLVWNDEFSGSSLDSSKWNYQTGTQDNYYGNMGPSYWGNSELQYYTEGDNVAVKDGALEITARKERKGDRDYTSARIVTRDIASWTFGYVEARMKLPKGDGMWPAFWMLPQPPTHNSSDNEYGGWAKNGEIDIMEAKGRLMNKVDTTIHYGGSWPQNTYSSHETTLSSDIDEWHTYAVEWTADYIAWIIDGKVEYKLYNNQWYTESSDAPSAPFDKPFYILFNFAVGGTYDPDGTRAMLEANTFTSATMYVDYVRVFQKSGNAKSAITAVAAAAMPQATLIKREEY